MAVVTDAKPISPKVYGLRNINGSSIPRAEALQHPPPKNEKKPGYITYRSTRLDGQCASTSPLARPPWRSFCVLSLVVSVRTPKPLQLLLDCLVRVVLGIGGLGSKHRLHGVDEERRAIVAPLLQLRHIEGYQHARETAVSTVSRGEETSKEKTGREDGLLMVLVNEIVAVEHAFACVG